MIEDSYFFNVFKSIDTENKNFLIKKDILEIIEEYGVYSHHQLQDLVAAVEKKFETQCIYYPEFHELIYQNFFVRKMLDEDLVIPGFGYFKKILKDVYDEI
jgi:hypothetical protein